MKEKFDIWVKRHAWVADEGIQFVPECNELMRGSYAMLDALGRFYSNTEGGHTYGPSILDVGVMRAWDVFTKIDSIIVEEYMNGRQMFES